MQTKLTHNRTLSSLRFQKLCEDFWYSLSNTASVFASRKSSQPEKQLNRNWFIHRTESVEHHQSSMRQAGLFYEATNSTSISFPTHLLCYHASVSKTFLLCAGIIYLWFRLKAVYRPTVLDEWIKHLPKNFIGPTRENKNVFTRKKHKMWA